MKKIILVFLAFVAALHVVGQKQNLLSGRFSSEELSKILIPRVQWTPFPRPDDRTGWEKADSEMLKNYLKAAEGYLSYQWPSIPATKSLLIERTGNRSEYESISFEKRRVLGTLLIAEIYENKGRFLDQIIDGIWSICEESFWGASAHLPKDKEYSGLMDISQPFVELFSAETATYLAWVDYFLGDKLDAVSPQLRKRIYLETNKRIFEPLMNKPHGWMSANANGRRPNNWNPWICSNWINAALLLEKDEARRTAMVAKALNVLDQFVNPYPQDGGCDEGPGYWGAAAASLYDNISLLNLASHDAFRYVYADEKIRNMGRFIYRAQISPRYFLNFADADPQPRMAASMIYRFGKDIKDPDMMKFGAYYRDQDEGSVGGFHFFRTFFSLFLRKEFKSAPKALPLPQDVWFPDLQVMIARDKPGSTDGFFLAAKGGNNDESHNHNDIGNYIVYYDGFPLLIDVGRGTYTRKTFSDKRYDIWFNCSDFHNVPTINGKTQPPGAAFKATSVAYSKQNGLATVSMELAQCYPSAADINSCRRTVTLRRGKSVEVVDVFSMKNASELTEHLMTCYTAEVGSRGELIIHYRPENRAAKDFVVKYDPSKLQPSVEKIRLVAMEDKGVLEKWGDNIYRINFKAVKPLLNEQLRFSIIAR